MKHIVCQENDFFGPWVCDLLGTNWFSGRGETVGLYDDHSGPLACALFESWNGASVILHFAKTPASRITRDLIWFCSYYPFVQLGIRKLLAPVESTNLRSRKFITHYGFSLEATLRDAAPNGDLLLYSMRKEDCPWLSLRGTKQHEANLAYV